MKIPPIVSYPIVTGAVTYLLISLNALDLRPGEWHDTELEWLVYMSALGFMAGLIAYPFWKDRVNNR